MPSQLVPHRSGLHRIAAIALYRALLTQCRAIALEPSQCDQLQNIVRNRFKQARHDHGIARLRLTFQAGYEAIDHLDAAVAGDVHSVQRIIELLDSAPAKVKQSPPVVLPYILRKEIEKRQKREIRQAKEEQQATRASLWERPLSLEKLSGRRHVPVLFSAAGATAVPVLRLKKPQPTVLSNYIGDRARRRQQWADRRQRLFEELDVARHEDAWDTIVAKLEQPNNLNTDHPSETRSEDLWISSIEYSLRTMLEQMNKERQKDEDMAVKMQGVIDREKELAKNEKAERDTARAKKIAERRNRQKQDSAGRSNTG